MTAYTSANTTYDGNSHTATGTATDVNGNSLASLFDLSGTTHTNAGTYNGDKWTFDAIGSANFNPNYQSASGTVDDSIARANATITVTGYTSASTTYDGNSHTATGTATGVKGETLNGLDLSGTTHTNAGSYNDSWSFTDSTGNYNSSSGTVNDSIAQANANPLVTAYTSANTTYDGNSHTATGTATDVNGNSLASLFDFSGTTHTNAGTYNGDAWTFNAIGSVSYNGNYQSASGTVNDSIAQADANPQVTGYNVTYDGNSHTATGTAMDVNGGDLSSLFDLSGTTHTDTGTYNGDAWTFNAIGSANYNPNYQSASGSVDDNIANGHATIMVTGYTSASTTYDGDSHTATGTATGVGGVDLSSLFDFSGTTHTNAGTYNGDQWTFNAIGSANFNPNYQSASGTVDDSIARANATITVTGYTSASTTYDGNSHTATGTATGVGGVSLSGLDLSGTTHTNAGSYSDSWSFTDSTGNYNNTSGTVNDSIAKANATITVTGYKVTYDGNAHTATGTAAGVGGANLGALFNLSGTSHTNAGTYNGDKWTFNAVGSANYNGNYNSSSGTVNDSIAKAASSITFTGSAYNSATNTYAFTFDGNNHPASATVTGAGALSTTPALTYYSGKFTSLSTLQNAINNGLQALSAPPLHVGTYTVLASYNGDANHTGSTALALISIQPQQVTWKPLGISYWSSHYTPSPLTSNYITNADVAFLNWLHLLTVSSGFTSTFSSPLQVALWLKGALSSNNMAYQLAGQLAVMELNVRHGDVSGSALVFAPWVQSYGLTNSNGYVSIASLMSDAEATILANPKTVSGSQARQYQYALEMVLAQANNGLNLGS